MCAMCAMAHRFSNGAYIFFAMLRNGAHLFAVAHQNLGAPKLLEKAETAIAKDDLVKNVIDWRRETDRSNYESFPKQLVAYDGMAHGLQKWRTQIFAMHRPLARTQDFSQNYPCSFITQLHR